MNTYAGESPAGSQVGAAQLHEWVHQVIALLDAAVCQLDHKQAVHGTIVHAASLIDSHIAGPVLVADLCALIQLSEAHFSRAFKRTFGKSPHTFVIRESCRVGGAIHAAD
jgi:AraC-like DNA-binding protein